MNLELGDPKFQSGDVPKAKDALEKLTKKMKPCIDDNGGLSGDTGEIELQFLVRAAGLAEGVDVLKAKGVSDAAKKCVRDAIQKSKIGTPSSDPVGVTVLVRLSAASP